MSEEDDPRVKLKQEREILKDLKEYSKWYDSLPKEKKDELLFQTMNSFEKLPQNERNELIRKMNDYKTKGLIDDGLKMSEGIEKYHKLAKALIRTARLNSNFLKNFKDYYRIERKLSDSFRSGLSVDNCNKLIKQKENLFAEIKKTVLDKLYEVDTNEQR